MSEQRTVHTQMYSNRDFTHGEMLGETTRYADHSGQIILTVNDHTKTAGVWLVRLIKAGAVDRQLELAI